MSYNTKCGAEIINLKELKQNQHVQILPLSGVARGRVKSLKGFT
jgi:hypothetical protein